MGSLERYLAKRDFRRTPEPSGGGRASALAPAYSIQKHAATRLHWDLRLEWKGVLLSWAVTRGPALRTAEKRLAVRTEDHPLSYLDFEGTIPSGNYGAGTVMLWDIGHWQPLADPDRGLDKGHLHFALHGQRMTGRWNLVRMRKGEARENWLLIKEDDEAAGQRDPVRRYTRSVRTGRSLPEIRREAAERPPPRRSGQRPRFRKPQLASLADSLPSDAGRWHELKFDGYRALVAIGAGGTRLLTRNGHDWTDRFAGLLPAFEALPCDTALIDGEVVAGAGLQGFAALQKAIAAGGPFQYQAFDLLHLDGEPLADLPLTERRTMLEGLFSGCVPLGPLQLSPVIRGDPAEALDRICGLGGEGLISKLMDAPYRGGRSGVWRKIKCGHRAEHVVVGWQRSDKRGRPFASLLLAVNEGDRLVYVGKVGTGFSGDAMEEIAERLSRLRRKSPTIEVPKPDAQGAVWVAPELVAEVTYAGTTDEGRLRHAVFVGLREDKEAAAVVREGAAREGAVDESEKRVRVAGIAISSGERQVFPDAGITKLDVANYYASVAERMLQVAADRPLSLVRLPEGLGGERFFQKHRAAGFPDAVRSLAIEERDGTTKDYLYVRDAAGLVGAAQMGTVEFHVWGARRDRLERPDRLVFDLDPDETLSFAAVRDAARDIRLQLEQVGLPSWPMVTGGKGVHVIVPLRRVAGWDTVALYAKTFAAFCVQREPDRFTATLSKAKRRGKIFIDWLRNERGATAICPFSLRARPGAPVAVPLSWSELAELDRPDAFDIHSVASRDWRCVARPDPVGLTSKIVEGLAAAIERSKG